MRQFGKKTLSLLMSLIMMFSVISITTTSVKADEQFGSSWMVNGDGTLSISETAANKAVGNMEKGNMILIGTKGGTIDENSFPSGANIVTKISNDKNAAMIRYTTEKTKAEIVTDLKSVKFSNSTTQVHIDVTYGSTTSSMEDINNFGVLNADGEAHVYKLIKTTSNISWIDAFDGAVKGTDTLGGLKGYLATVTTSEEAELVRNFYNSNEAGTWIAGTSLRYSENSDSDYNSASKVTPENYSSIESTASVYEKKITATSGAYYCPFGSSTVSANTYYDYYYWACGPEQGQAISASLWASGEPNNSDGSRGGETCIVSPWGGNANFNDFSPFNSVKAYFLEFSAYAGGLVSDATYNSITVYKVTLDGNGASGSIAPMEKFKDETLTIRTDYTGLTVPNNNTWLAGWFATDSETDYTRVVTYTDNAPTTLYAHWSQFGYTSQYDPVARVGLVYDGTSQLLIDNTTDGYGVWRVNAPTDGNTNSFTYWYSKSEGSGYEEGSIYDSSKTGNVGYIAALNTNCIPLYETNAGTYNIYWNWSYKAGSAKKGYITVTIDPKSINADSITVTTAPINGGSQVPIITIKDGSIGTDLVPETDYEISYEGTGTTNYSNSTAAPTEVGTYKAIITGKNNYKDSREIEFTINEKIQTSVSTEVKKSADAPALEVSNLNNELALKLLTDEEKAEYESGVPVNVYLSVNVLDRSKVPEVDLAVIDKMVSDDGYTYGQCLDLSLWKQVGNDAAVQIHDTKGNPIMIKITVPDALKDAPEGYKRTFRIVRVHDGVSTVLAEGTGPTFDISSDKFSSYFILYKDVETAKKDNSVLSTGDNMHIGIVVMVMIDSIMAALYLTLRKKLIK